MCTSNGNIYTVYGIPLNLYNYLQDLYERAYTHGSMCKYSLFTVHPRRWITPDLIVSDIPSPAVIIVEEDEQAPDPTDILTHNQVTLQ